MLWDGQVDSQARRDGHVDSLTRAHQPLRYVHPASGRCG